MVIELRSNVLHYARALANVEVNVTWKMGML